MVQTASCDSGIATRCSILAVSISITALSRVVCWCIGALNIPLGIGAFSGVVTLVAAFKADNIDTGTVVVIGAVVVVVVVWAREIVVGTVGIVGTCSWWGSISRLGHWLKGVRLLTARTFLDIHPPLTSFKHCLALGLQLDGLVQIGRASCRERVCAVV